MDYRVISIGALSRHELWTNPPAEGAAHATTTLIRSGKKAILVDPALPIKALAPRLAERAGLQPDDITDVFLTCFRPAHRWGLSGFTKANWWISELERETVGRTLVEQFQNTEDEEIGKLLKQDIELLQNLKAAPDKLADQVDLFPSPGFTPGTCALLLSPPNSSIVIAGDAVATGEHLEAGRVLRGAYDAEQAMESLSEIIEIADVIVPGHDNVLINPVKRPF